MYEEPGKSEPFSKEKIIKEVRSRYWNYQTKNIKVSVIIMLCEVKENIPVTSKKTENLNG